jgi:elongation factor Ts
VDEPKKIPAADVKALRDATGAGMMDAKKALAEADGDVARATEILRERGLADAKKRAGRSAEQGVIAHYIHFNGTVGVLAEVNCETDFVANTDDFKKLARDVALHIASAAPQYVRRQDVPDEVLDGERRVYAAQLTQEGKPEEKIPMIIEGKLGAFYKDVVLVDQPFVKDDSKSVGELLDEVAALVQEKVAVRRFVRYKLGEELESSDPPGEGSG